VRFGVWDQGSEKLETSLAPSNVEYQLPRLSSWEFGKETKIFYYLITYLITFYSSLNNIYMTDCLNKSICPSLGVFNSKLNYIYQTESIVMKSNNKEQIFNTKRRKYVSNLDA